MTDSGKGAIELLAANGLIGLVWADSDLSIFAQEGELADSAIIGESLCDCIVPLIGLDDQLRALMRHLRKPIIMANVSIADADGQARRCNYCVMWDPAGKYFLLSITPALAIDALALEREQHLRREFQLKAQLAAQRDAIADANEALQRTNADLVDFTRIVSHDLKSPMRALRYSADDIEAALVERGDVDPLVPLDKLRRQSRRLSAMVTDLLAYSRLDHKEDALDTVDTRSLIEDIVASLHRPDAFTIRIGGDWPVLHTIGALLDVVLRNTIDNAIKHHDRADGVVEIIAARDDSALEVGVLDDGPGIDPRYLEAVFQPFVRLSPERSEGTGMGLALVRRAVESVGGTIMISVRGDSPSGTCVAIRWPLTIKAK